MIPYSRQNIGADDIREVVKTLKSPYLTQGPKIKEFEDSLCKYTGARFCVAFSSGTSALHAAYFAAGIGKGDEVVVPALTFAATGNAALYLEARPVFVDIKLETGNVDPQEVEANITKKTKVIVGVDYAGHPAQLDALHRIAKRHKILFIEDAAQGLGASYRGKKLGTLADMTMFSFHPVKSITTGEGGAITTQNKAFYEKLLMFRTHGLTRDPKLLKDKSRAEWHQEMQILGYNYRLTDIQAALGVSQMRKLDRFVGERRRLAARYYKLFKRASNVILPTHDRESAWHLFVIRIASEKKNARDIVFRKLRAAGIWAQVHYIPVYLHPYYRALGYKKGLCPKAEAFTNACISIPLYPGLSKKDQERVVREVQRACASV